MLQVYPLHWYPLSYEERQLLEEQQPVEGPQVEKQPVVTGKLKYRWYFNRNHLIKSKNGAKRPAGFKRIRRRFKRTLKPNSSHATLQKPVRVDADLAAVIGCETTSRAQILKLLWDYIKANKLQNPQNGRLIVPDAKLALVVGSEGEEINGFTMMKTVKHHILKDDVTQG